jgi:hypothetical protein
MAFEAALPQGCSNHSLKGGQPVLVTTLSAYKSRASSEHDDPHG